jgi:hypothetical protein
MPKTDIFITNEGEINMILEVIRFYQIIQFLLF